MPSPKTGKAGTPIDPAEPAKAEEADKADPGEVEKIKAEQRQTQTGKYGSVKTKAHKPPESQEEKEKQKKKVWIEVELLDALDNPVAGEQYRITLPDNSVAEGTLDEKGLVRLEGIDPGNCKITFPGYDGRSWEKA